MSNSPGRITLRRRDLVRRRGVWGWLTSPTMAVSRVDGANVRCVWVTRIRRQPRVRIFPAGRLLLVKEWWKL